MALATAETDTAVLENKMPGLDKFDTIGDLTNLIADHLPTGLEEAVAETETPPETTQEEVKEDAKGQETEKAEETEEESKSDESEESEEPEWFQKRIDRFTRKLRESEEDKDGLRDQISALEKRVGRGEEPPAPVASAPREIASLEDPKDIERAKDLQEQRLEWVEDLFDQLKDDPDRVERELKAQKVNLHDGDGDEDYSEANMRKFLRGVQRHSSKSLRTWIPQREKSLKEEADYSKDAENKYPWLKDKKSQEYKLYQQEIDGNPGIKKHPQHKLLIARYVRGLLLEADPSGSQLSETPAKTPPAKQPGRPVATKSKTSPRKTRADDNSDQLRKDRGTFLSDANPEALSNLIENFIPNDL